MIDLDVHLPAVVTGDTRAYGAFLAGAEPVVRRSLRLFAARVDVEAVLQEALLRLWQAAPRVEPDGRPNALLRLGLVIAKNLAKDELRRRREEPIPEGIEGASEPALPDPILRSRIEQCFHALPPQPGAAMRARIAAGGAEADAIVAARLGMQPNTFFQNVARARKLLLACLERSGLEVAL